MCIIAYVPAGKTLKEETIKAMFKRNPDGAGIMWKPRFESDVQIRKGFMKVEDLIEAFKAIPESCERAIHCRIATSGKVSVGCCHPFPVRAKASAMRSAKDTAQMAIMHNGVISYTTPKDGMSSKYSDSMLFASRILYPLQKMLDSEAVQTLIEASTQSRLLIFRAYQEVMMFGDWTYDKESGVYFSNSYGWKEMPTYAKTSYGYDYGCNGNYYTNLYGRYGGYGKYYGDNNTDATKTVAKKDEKPSEDAEALDKSDDDCAYGDGYSIYDEDMVWDPESQSYLPSASLYEDKVYMVTFDISTRDEGATPDIAREDIFEGLLDIGIDVEEAWLEINDNDHVYAEVYNMPHDLKEVLGYKVTAVERYY